MRKFLFLSWDILVKLYLLPQWDSAPGWTRHGGSGSGNSRTNRAQFSPKRGRKRGEDDHKQTVSNMLALMNAPVGMCRQSRCTTQRPLYPEHMIKPAEKPLSQPISCRLMIYLWPNYFMPMLWMFVDWMRERSWKLLVCLPKYCCSRSWLSVALSLMLTACKLVCYFPQSSHHAGENLTLDLFSF